MPKGGTGRHWRQTPAPGKDAPRCAAGDGKTAIRQLAGVPLCRPHFGAGRAALGAAPDAEQVRQWLAERAAAAEPEPAAGAVEEEPAAVEAAEAE